MDKSWRSFLFWTIRSRKWALAWLLAIVAVTLSRLLENNRRPSRLRSSTRTRACTHTHISLCLTQVNKVWPQWQQRTCWGTGCTFVYFFWKKSSDHTQINVFEPFGLAHPSDGTSFQVLRFRPEFFSGLWKCSPTYDTTSASLVPLPSFPLICIQMTFLSGQLHRSSVMNETASFT